MKVLLLHPEDEFSPPAKGASWDLVVDFARAPGATYERWRREGNCRVISLYDFEYGPEDLSRLRGLLQAGLGAMVDGEGIDWWDITIPPILAETRQCLLIRRLADNLGAGCELYGSRPDPQFQALGSLLGGSPVNLAGSFRRAWSRVEHYREALSGLDARTFLQVLQDKFDPRHSLRRRLFRSGPNSGQPLVLLPSAYINVSRTEVAYASLLPECQFLLALARRNGRLGHLPHNVRMISLDPYFAPVKQQELASLLENWRELSQRLIAGAPEFAAANAAGVLARVPWVLRWGMTIRDAWKRLYDSETITACLSADDSNPYTRIPLILAQKRGIPALACHHGVFDYRVAVKPLHADFYLAKAEIERDYLLRVCGVVPQKIVLGGPAPQGKERPGPGARHQARPWLVFFTEPYGIAGWRVEEVYRDLLPRVLALAESCGLQVVFKLHPFENVPAHWRRLRRYLPKEKLPAIQVMAGAITSELWQKARLALTVQSTVALECATEGVPVFLCAWLQLAISGYIQQYEKFGIARVLNSPAEIADIPRWLETQGGFTPVPEQVWKALDAREFQGLLRGRRTPAGETTAS
jgi:hypothetical protein